MGCQSFSGHPDVIECRRRIELAAASLNSLHLGPLDYNVATTKDDLVVAIRLLEKLESEHKAQAHV